MHYFAQYEEPLYLDPAFPVAFHEDWMDATRKSIYTNWHPNMEILYFPPNSGKAHMIADTKLVAIPENSVAVIDSDSIHSIHTDSETCHYYCLKVDAEFLNDSGLDLDKLSFNCAATDETVLRAFLRIVEELEGEKEYYKPATLAAIIDLFVSLLRAGYAQRRDSGQRVESRHQALITSALSYIRANLDRSISIDELCTQVGVSKYYFCRLFRSYTGLSIIQYVNAMKCTLARRLMIEEGMNVSQAARYLGYENLSYFSRMYKQHIGNPPSDEVSSNDVRKIKGREYGLRGDTLHDD